MVFSYIWTSIENSDWLFCQSELSDHGLSHDQSLPGGSIDPEHDFDADLLEKNDARNLEKFKKVWDFKSFG